LIKEEHNRRVGKRVFGSKSPGFREREKAREGGRIVQVQGGQEVKGLFVLARLTPENGEACHGNTGESIEGCRLNPKGRRRYCF